MYNLGDVILQVAIVILPFFLYDALWLNRFHHQVPKQNKFVICSISSISVILSYIVKADIDHPYFLSFSTIIIISAILYGGAKIGMAVLLIELASYYLFTRDGVFIYVLSTILYTIYPFYLSLSWEKINPKKKIIHICFLTLLYVWISIFTLLIELTTDGVSSNNLFETLSTYTIIGIVLTATMMFHIYLREYMYENAELRVKAQNTEKLNIISELAASVAHEVRNPLTVVRGFIQLLETQEKGENKEYMKLVLSELDRAESIISDYLNLARPQIEEKRLVHFSEQLKEVTTLMSSYAIMKGAFLQVDVEKNLLVIGDQGKLKQAIMNILKNGIEAINTRKGYIRITARKEGENIVVRVKDNGVGMSKEQLERLGQPYYSLKEKGTGLGLMVTFTIIQAHDGRIRYESEPDIGTEVIIILPAAPNKSALKLSSEQKKDRKAMVVNQ
ncbi:MAG: ATP-binding protein [Bacillaceae bacterium]